ncbi:unnamed protein product [Eretmochelys imbricata]
MGWIRPATLQLESASWYSATLTTTDTPSAPDPARCRRLDQNPGPGSRGEPRAPGRDPRESGVLRHPRWPGPRGRWSCAVRSWRGPRSSAWSSSTMYRDVAGSWLAVLPRGPAGYRAPQWNRTGLQSSAWLRGAVTLSAPPPEQPFKVVFRATRTPDFDLALDSVSIRLGPCSPCGTGCHFDSLDDPCGWQNPPGTGGARWGQWVGAGAKPGVGPQDDFSKPGRVTGADLGTPLLSLQGDQGADWQRRVVNYTGTSEIQVGGAGGRTGGRDPERGCLPRDPAGLTPRLCAPPPFVFQGSYAEKPEPGLAVDSVWVWPCEETCTQYDFNNASDPLCGWAQPQSTATEETGPPGDYPHWEGYYIYAEAGSLQLGQSVSLESRDFCTADAVCVVFYCYTAGIVQTGTQLRELARGPSGPALPLWTRTGLQSPAWLLGSSSVPAGRLQPTRIVFEVVRGNLPYPDVALDNVSTSPGYPAHAGLLPSRDCQAKRHHGNRYRSNRHHPHGHHGDQLHSNGFRPHLWVSSPLCDPIDSARCAPPSRAPPNAHYEACGPACPPHCDDPQPGCDLPCRPGCQCDAGHLLSGGALRPPRRLRLLLSPHRLPGQPGRLDSASCVAAGDPHYTTFDKRKFDFQGTCPNVLAQPCNASLALAPFAVHAANEPRHGQGAVFCVQAVFVELPGATVALLKNRVVQVNGSQVTLPALPTPSASVRLSGTFAEVRTDFGLVVWYDGNHFTEVQVSRQYRGALCGLCGDYNGDPGNDFRIPRAAGSAGDFGDSWGVGNAGGSAWRRGNPHYTTFDGRLFHFMGTCSYTLTQTCNASTGLPGFSVEATNEHRGASTRVSYVRAAAVEVFGHRVALLKGR